MIVKIVSLLCCSISESVATFILCHTAVTYICYFAFKPLFWSRIIVNVGKCCDWLNLLCLAAIYILFIDFQSELSDVSPNEEFTTSLGVDQSLHITCQPVGVVHNTRSGLRSKTTSITYTQKFQVKNTKSHPVSIHLSEQVPLSSDEKVKVCSYCVVIA